MLFSNVLRKTINFGPIIFLYYLSISEIDTNFENQFEILSFNIQLIMGLMEKHGVTGKCGVILV